MRALTWHGRNDVRVESVPNPKIQDPKDAIVRVTTSAICGSDLHIYDGYIPSMQSGDILGHEFVGEVVEIGNEVRSLSPGDRVVVPFPIACGECFFCQRQLYSLCERSNPNAEMASHLFGHSPAGIYGYSHLMGGFPGGQAQYVRVPYADVGPMKLPEDVTDEQAVMLSDVFPTGFMAAENSDIQPGDTVAVWGCGPVGQFAIRSAFMLGAGRVIAIDRFRDRLSMAQRDGGADTVNYENDKDVVDVLKQKTDGRGPDACIDAVGSEAHGRGLFYIYDRLSHALRMQTDRPYALRQAITACRKGGTVSVAGVYGGFIDKFPMGAVMNKALTLRSGQTHVQKYMRPLLDRIEKHEIDPSFIVTHRKSLEEAPDAYRMFREKSDQCIKVVLRP